jgi:hypothetical protein
MSRASRGLEWRRCRVLPSPPAVDFASPDGKRLFAEALEGGTMEGFFSLASCFQMQSPVGTCLLRPRLPRRRPQRARHRSRPPLEGSLALVRRDHTRLLRAPRQGQGPAHHLRQGRLPRVLLRCFDPSAPTRSTSMTCALTSSAAPPLGTVISSLSITESLPNR